MAAKKRGSGLIWIILLILALGGGGFYAWRAAKKKEQAVDFRTAPITRGDIVQSVTANGQLVPVKNVQVGSQVSGIIQELFVDFNSRVTNGQIIARIDPSTYKQNISQTEAELANAEAAMQYARLNHVRAKELRQSDLISPSEYEKTVADLAQAEAVVKMREASLNKAKVDLERTTIYAPVDGVVISRVVDVGQTVAASLNAPTLFQIAHDLREMRIEAMVSEADVGGVAEGLEVSFQVDAFPTRKFVGKVSQVRYAPITNQNVVNYTAIVDVRNDDLKLRPGMTATASIITDKKEGVLRISNAALRFRPADDMLPKGATNAPSASTNMTSGENKTVMAARGEAGPRREGSPRGGGGADSEERRRRWDSMTPEQREEMRARFGGGAGGGAFGSRRGEQEGPVARTVYILDKSAGQKPQLKPVTIKTGISDGSYTEVLDGLKEGDEVVTGLNLPLAGPASTMPQGRSPFGGPPFGGGGMRPR